MVSVNLSPLDIEQRIDCLLAIAQNRAQFRAAPVPRTNDFFQRDGGSTSQVRTNCPAQEPLPVEDTNLAQIARVDTKTSLILRYTRPGSLRYNGVPENGFRLGESGASSPHVSTRDPMVPTTPASAAGTRLLGALLRQHDEIGRRLANDVEHGSVAGCFLAEGTGEPLHLTMECGDRQRRFLSANPSMASLSLREIARRSPASARDLRTRAANPNC